MRNIELSVKEYAELKGVKIDAVYKAVKRNTVKHKKIGSHIIIILD